MTTTFKRSVAGALAAAVLLTSFGFAPAQAASAKPQVAQSQATTDFSARSRRYSRGNSAAALAAFATVFGTIAVLAAQDQYRNDYYGPGYGYYGGGYGYAPGYRHGGWHHHRHWR
jgi:hypothetical protein